MPIKKPGLKAWLEEMGVNFQVGETTKNCMEDAHLELTPSGGVGGISSPSKEFNDLRKAFAPDKIGEDAQKQAGAASSLEDLKKVMQEFDGCRLKKTATQMVFSDGCPSSSVMLIGEAPGAEEDRQGKPFVGMSGQLLDKMFGFIGLDRETSLYITNVVPWRPPGNRTPSSEEISACLPFLRRHIELINPSIICLVGGTAAKALLGSTEGIMRLRGRWHEYSMDSKRSVPCLAIFHPAYLLRSPSKKREMWQDLLALKHALPSDGAQRTVA